MTNQRRFNTDQHGNVRLASLKGFWIGEPVSGYDVVALRLETHGRPGQPSQTLECLLTPAQATQLAIALQSAAHRQEYRQ